LRILPTDLGFVQGSQLPERLAGARADAQPKRSPRDQAHGLGQDGEHDLAQHGGVAVSHGEGWGSLYAQVDSLLLGKGPDDQLDPLKELKQADGLVWRGARDLDGLLAGQLVGRKRRCPLLLPGRIELVTLP